MLGHGHLEALAQALREVPRSRPFDRSRSWAGSTSRRWSSPATTTPTPAIPTRSRRPTRSGCRGRGWSARTRASRRWPGRAASSRGPAGSAAAAWAARAGADVVLADAAVFPRDKTCGDGLTPRAIAELDRLGLGDWVRAHGRNRGLRAAGFGQELLLPWPGGSLPDHGGAVPAHRARRPHPRRSRSRPAPRPLDGARAVDVERDGDRVTGVVFSRGRREPFRGRLPPAGRRRRRALAAGQGARPRVAPRHRLRRRRARLRRAPAAATTRGSARTSSCAASDGRAAVRLRLDLPARRDRRGEPRRRHAGHRRAARPTSSCAA